MSGFFASLAFFKVGKWILPDFRKSIYTKIGVYLLLGVLGILLILLIILGFIDRNIIQSVSYIILILELIFVFIIIKDEI